MPRILVEVGTVEAPLMRLKLMDGINIEPYATLSYCWGDKHEEDRLIAFEGIRSSFDIGLGDDYFFGLRGADMYNGLLWFNGNFGDWSISSSLVEPFSLVSGALGMRLRIMHVTFGIDDEAFAIPDSEALNQKIIKQASISRRENHKPTWSWAYVQLPINFCRFNNPKSILRSYKVPTRLMANILGTGHIKVSKAERPYILIKSLLAETQIGKDAQLTFLSYLTKSKSRGPPIQVLSLGWSAIFLDKDELPRDEPRSCFALIFHQSGYHKADSGYDHSLLTLLLLQEFQVGREEDSKHDVMEERLFERIGFAVFIEERDISMNGLDQESVEYSKIYLI